MCLVPSRTEFPNRFKIWSAYLWKRNILQKNFVEAFFSQPLHNENLALWRRRNVFST